MACGIGAGAKGFNQANPRVGNLSARFECAGGIDVDPGAIRNFERMTGVKGTVMDLFDREQYAPSTAGAAGRIGARLRRPTSGAPSGGWT
jgi:site-specific DNA-cytosine methylase